VNTVDQAVKAYPDKLEKATAVTLPYSVGIAVPRNKHKFRSAIMEALVAIQKAGIETTLLKKWSLDAGTLEAPRLVLAD
jgi:polar amino acid transport system substrate-binding protein